MDLDESTLHIVNGDSTSNLIRDSVLQGDLLPWRDVLHDGPVPGGLSLAKLSDVRARFLGVPEHGGYAKVRENFKQRDQHLYKAEQYAELILWFEHDLYDQLQILQILQLVEDGVKRPIRMFGAWQRLEPAPFLGDWSFWRRIGDLVNIRQPLLRCHPQEDFRYPEGYPMDPAFKEQTLELTGAGKEVLEGRADAVELNGIDRWYGGVHLKAGRPLWRWDSETMTLVTGKE